MVGSLFVGLAALHRGFPKHSFAWRVKNMSVLMAFCAGTVLAYGMFGLVGLRGDGGSFLYIPLSVWCTVFMTPFLLVLDYGVSAGSAAAVVGGLSLLLPCVYALMLRGMPLTWILGNGIGDQVHASHDRLFDAFYGGVGNEILHIGTDVASQSEAAVRKAAALASVGFFTSQSWGGWVVNAIGVCCTLPNFGRIALVQLDDTAIVEPLDLKLGLAALAVPILSCGYALPQVRLLGVYVLFASILTLGTLDSRKRTKSKAF